ncbi:restriction endonuclease subunit S [Hallella bergensis]|uniref:restriction endonuclease subunit S n=1 Tax=Hallella bergensis TaxID=242750 RepID=UPI003990B497
MKKYKLGEIGEIRMCKRILKHETNDTAGIPFFKIGTFGGKADSFIDKEKYDNYKKRFPFPKKGDILLSAAGTIGKAVKYSGEDAYYQDSNIVWLEHDESIILNKYLYYIYQSINWNVSKGSTILRLYNDDIRNTEVFIPDLLHQEKVADLLSLIDQKVTINRSINHNLVENTRHRLLPVRSSEEVEVRRVA